MKRRAFLGISAGAVAALGDLSFLSRLGAVRAEETKLEAGMVALHPEIEPLVRFLEETPRERVLEELAGKIRRGLSYREVLAALLLAGVRNIQPRPVGFKFHAVLVVNSAHLASLIGGCRFSGQSINSKVRKRRMCAKEIGRLRPWMRSRCRRVTRRGRH
jgi:hypothetical protein